MCYDRGRDSNNTVCTKVRLSLSTPPLVRRTVLPPSNVSLFRRTVLPRPLQRFEAVPAALLVAVVLSEPPALLKPVAVAKPE